MRPHTAKRWGWGLPSQSSPQLNCSWATWMYYLYCTVLAVSLNSPGRSPISRVETRIALVSFGADEIGVSWAYHCWAERFFLSNVLFSSHINGYSSKAVERISQSFYLRVAQIATRR